MSRKISDKRKNMYNIGLVLMVIGGLLFASAFVMFIANFGNHSDFDSKVKLVATVSLAGVGLLVIGGIIRTIGARGLAGSGVILDPQKAREELEPYTRMAGGMLKDALDETDIKLGSTPEKIIMIRCPSCDGLNEEDSKFCQECGEQI